MSKLKAYLELATDKSAKTVAKELKDKDDNIEALIEQLRLMILGKLKRSSIKISLKNKVKNVTDFIIINQLFLCLMCFVLIYRK